MRPRVIIVIMMKWMHTSNCLGARLYKEKWVKDENEMFFCWLTGGTTKRKQQGK